MDSVPSGVQGSVAAFASGATAIAPTIPAAANHGAMYLSELFILVVLRALVRPCGGLF